MRHCAYGAVRDPELEMPREDVTSRTVTALLAFERALHDPVRRWLTVGVGITAVVALHAVTGDPRVAWLAAIPAILAGLAGGARFGMAAAAVAAAGHLGVDLALGNTGAALFGEIVRTLTLPALGVTGSAIQQLEEQRDLALLRSATEDSITGLLNVRTFYDGLADLRAQGIPYSIVIADIAGMRDLNERYGHPTGTEALRALGHVLRRSVKRDDLVARLGSDEVAIALVGADEAGARSAAERLSKRLAEESFSLPDGQQVRVHAYFGIASASTDADADAVGLLRAAGHAVSAAKERGPDEITTADEHAAEDPSTVHERRS